MRLLLNICCAPDATHPIRILKEEHDITAFFYNPNIHPKAEHEKRLGDMRALAKKWGIPIIEGRYDEARWLALTENYREEPEGGKRCEICYRMRLEETAKKAIEDGYEIFGAVLTISPHKNAAKINAIGREAGEKYKIPFLESDFKKKDGFKKSVEMSRKLGLYRQDYCGCVYSKRQ